MQANIGICLERRSARTVASRSRGAPQLDGKSRERDAPSRSPVRTHTELMPRDRRLPIRQSPTAVILIELKAPRRRSTRSAPRRPCSRLRPRAPAASPTSARCPGLSSRRGINGELIAARRDRPKIHGLCSISKDTSRNTYYVRAYLFITSDRHLDRSKRREYICTRAPNDRRKYCETVNYRNFRVELLPLPRATKGEGESRNARARVQDAHWRASRDRG